MMTIPLAEQYLGDAGDFLLINRFARRTGWLHTPLTGYAGYGVAPFVLLLAAGWWLARRSGDVRMMAAEVWAVLGTLVAVALNQPIVHAISEKRPYTSIPHVLVLVGRSSDYGFPSDHATMAGAVAAGLCYINRRLGIVAWIAAALLAFSRVYVGAHYPHDVAAGLALGAAVIVIGQVGARPLLARAITRLTGTPLRPLLTATPATPALLAAATPSSGPPVASSGRRTVDGKDSMTSIVEHLLNVRGVLVYLLVGLLALAEDALFVGFVIPGETAAVLGGVIASRDHVDYPLIAVIVVAAAIIGDTVGYEIGRHPGPRILRVPILDQRRGRLDDAQSSLRRRGGSAVFLGRFVAFFRAVMPALAGSWHRCMRPVLSRHLPPTRWLPSWAAARWRGTARCGSWDFCSG